MGVTGYFAMYVYPAGMNSCTEGGTTGDRQETCSVLYFGEINASSYVVPF